MRYHLRILTLMCAMLPCAAFWPSGRSLASPQKAQPGGQPDIRTRTNAQHGNNVDACSLLTGKEITDLLGEPLDALNPSARSAGNLKMSHCLFVTRNFAKSASLDVATPASGDSGARSLRAFWRNQFHSPRKHEEEKRPASRKTPAQSAFTPAPGARTTEVESESEAEAEAGKPLPVAALGEEAYWVGSPLAGALYVLRGNLFMRISVGGIPIESTRMAKSKSIANAVLLRLRH
jgi:hypothetical protein